MTAHGDALNDIDVIIAGAGIAGATLALALNQARLRPVLIDPVVDELGSREAIDGVRKILKTGTGADRQLKVFEETNGDLKAVVDYMAEETRAGL